MKRNDSGFTLIELMIAVAVVSILCAVAIPAYGNYVMRGRLVEAYSGLGMVQTSAEEYWSNKRTYADLDKDTPSRLPPAGNNFSFSLTSANDSSYLVTATGRNQAAGFEFTIDQGGNRATTRSPAGWGTSTSCWINAKGGKCVQ